MSTPAWGGTEQLYRPFLERLWDRVAATDWRPAHPGIRRSLRLRRVGSRVGDSDLNRPMATVSVDHQGNFSTFDPELLSVETSYGTFNLGHVLHDSLEAACTTRKIPADMGRHAGGAGDLPQSCSYFGVCGGGAGSNKYWETGSLRAGETQACRYRIKLTTDVVLTKLERELKLT